VNTTKSFCLARWSFFLTATENSEGDGGGRLDSGEIAAQDDEGADGSQQQRQEGGGEGWLVLEEEGQRRGDGNSELQPDSAMASGTRERGRNRPRKRGEGSE
jgi:hypothetical protein